MLEKLFTSKNRIKVLEFLFFNKEESYIREISKELKISSSAVKREADNLIEIGILEKKGNKISLNKKSIIIDELKNIFIKTDYIVYPIKEAIDNGEIEYALIYGSFASNKNTNESDIDLLVITNLKASEIYSLLKKVEEKIKRAINPVVWNRENLIKEKNSGFVKDIFKKKIIMLKGDENELRKIIR